MKILELKHSNAKVRTLGQLSCDGNPAHSTSLFGHHHAAEPRNPESDMMRSNVRRTLSNSRSLGYPLQARDPLDKRSPVRNRMAFCIDSKNAYQTEPSTLDLERALTEQPTFITRRTSDMGVQVDMFHCQECTAHVKLCKNLKHEDTCNDSDSETNLIGNGCTNNENEVQLFKPDVPPRDHYPAFDHKSSGDHEASAQSSKDNVPLSDHGSRVKAIGGRMLQLGIKISAFVILIFLLVSYLMQTQIFEAVIPEFNYYIRKYFTQEEIEGKFSAISWIYHALFSVQISPTPLSWLLKLLTSKLMDLW